MLLNFAYTGSTIRLFYKPLATLPNVRPLSKFFNIQKLRQPQYMFQVFKYFRTSYMAICAAQGIYCFLTAKLSLLLVVAQIILFLSIIILNGFPTLLLLPIHLCFYIAPEGILSTQTIISYIVGHYLIMANQPLILYLWIQ